MSELKKLELDTWKKWKKSGDQEHLNTLLRSMDPFLQSYVNKFSSSPLPRPAIESQARILAVKAFGSYNPKKGAALNTHLGHELKHLTRYVLEYQNVGKIPENRGIAISKFHNIKSHLTEELGREPSVAELSDSLQWSPAEVERMQSELRQDLNITQGKEEAFFDVGFNTTDDVRDMAEFVYYSVGPEEQRVAELTFGIGGNPRLTPEQIALRVNKTVGQVRSIQKDLAAQIHKARGNV